MSVERTGGSAPEIAPERRRWERLLVIVAFGVAASGCAGWITPDGRAHVPVASDLRCCGRQAGDGDLRVAALDVPATPEDSRATRPGACRVHTAAFESPLRRDALGMAPIVGRVFAGEPLTVLDFIDRRLRVLDRLVFDGGHWRKVRGQNGDVGWIPATLVNEGRRWCDSQGIALGMEEGTPPSR